MSSLINIIEEDKEPLDGSVPENVMRSSEYESPAFNLEGILYKNLSQGSRERISKDGFVHISSLNKICPRQYALALKHDVDIVSAVYPSTTVMWGLGRAIEVIVRDGLISYFGRDKIYADWRCSCRETSTFGLHEEKVCPSCNTSVDVYNEAVFYDRKNGIKGSPDLLYIHNGVLNIVEIKSVKGTGAKSFESYRDCGEETSNAYLFQVASYYYLLGVNGLKVNPIASILFCNKEFEMAAPIYNMVIDARDHYDTVLQAREVGKEVLDFVTEGTLPEKTCDDIMCRSAKACPLAIYCFAERT